MDFKTKENILKEIEKEEKLCKDIYQEILKNRVKYEEEIRTLKLKNNSARERINHSKETLHVTVEKALSPIKILGSNENLYFSKNGLSYKSPASSKHNKISQNSREMRIPLGSIPGSLNFDGISSRKNPLDSLRNTTDRNEIIGSFDSLEYSEDISFL
jgi:nuclear transport factor 2 (NTF2) superfamily protein